MPDQSLQFSQALAQSKAGFLASYHDERTLWKEEEKRVEGEMKGEEEKGEKGRGGEQEKPLYVYYNVQLPSPLPPSPQTLTPSHHSPC